MKSGDYLEAKSGSITYKDIQSKIIRYKAAQLNRDLVPSDGVMKVIALSGEFTDGRSGELNKVGKLLRDTRGVTKGTVLENK